MDDVHWADEPSLLLIEHMAALMPEIRVIGVGTYRDVELEVARPLAATLERMVRARTVERLSVKRFDRAAVAVMLEALAGKPPPPAIVDAVFDETEGNAFFVEEVFWHLVEERKIFDEAGNFRTDLEVDELDVPESVRLVVGRRLERLGPEAQRILAAGAVVGRGFRFTLLESITTESDAGRLLDIMEEAEAAKVIVPEERDGEIHYTFAHELIRQTLLSGLSLLRRQRLHLAIADAMERTDPTASQTRPSEIAHHLLQAGAGASPERTLRFLELTAERALDAAAFEEAFARGRRRAVTRRRGRARTAGEAPRAEGLGVPRAGRLRGVPPDLGRRRPALPADRRARAGRRPVLGDGDPVRLVGPLRRGVRGLRARAAAPGRRAHPDAGDAHGCDRDGHGAGGLLRRSRGAVRRRVRARRAVGNDRTLGRAEWGHTVAYWSNTRIELAIESGRAAIEHLRSANDAWTLVDALAWTAFPVVFNGSLREGGRLAQEAVDLGTALGHIAGEILGRRALTMATYLEDGDLEVLEERVREDLERFESIRSPWVSQSHAWLASIRMLRGDLEESLHHADEALRLEPESAWSGIGWSFRFLNRAVAGDRDTCLAMLEEQRGVLPQLGEMPTMGRTTMLYNAAQGCAIVGLVDEAAALAPIVAEHADRFPISPFGMSLAHRIAGMAASAARTWDRAEEHLERARQAAEELPVPAELPEIRYWHARMLLDRADAADGNRARDLLAAALDGYRRLGMPIHAAKAQELLG